MKRGGFDNCFKCGCYILFFIRYNECKDKILPYLKKLGFTLNKDLHFLPCSGQMGQGLLQPVDEKICPWYK